MRLAKLFLLGFLTVSTGFLTASTNAQKPGFQKQNFLPSFPIQENGRSIDSKVVLDANWRWIHYSGQYTNCFDGRWSCPDPFTCAANCELEGVEQSEYPGTYGISTSGNALTLKYVTNGPYGRNVGSRVYITEPDGQTYKMFYVLGKQISFDVDVSKVPCGLNGAVYFVEMPADGGKSVGMPGVPYGTGYGDAQCPRDIKYINGFVNTNNTGVCSPEFDLWEANSDAYQVASHPCSIKGVVGCSDPKTCGDGSNRYSGVCDKDGASYNPYREGKTSLYGPGKQFSIDSTKPFTVTTQFFTSSDGDLVKVVQILTQNGRSVTGAVLDDATIATGKTRFGEQNHHAQLGGLKKMGESLKRGVVFVQSLWDDSSVNMLWLDSVYPKGGTAPGNKRGPCDPNRQGPEWLRNTYPNAQVVYSNVRVEAISGGQTPTPSPAPFPVPIPTPGGIKLVCNCTYA